MNQNQNQTNNQSKDSQKNLMTNFKKTILSQNFVSSSQNQNRTKYKTTKNSPERLLIGKI